MGSFSFSCQLSGLPITSGTKCAILPMLPKNNFYDNGEEHYRKTGVPSFCSNDGSNMFFNEFTFPIFGEYDDYGGIKNIIKDDNTKCLEEYFELSIEDICTVLCDNRKDEYSKDGKFCKSVKILDKNNPRHMKLLKASLVWLHGELYETLSTEKLSSWSDKLDIGVHGILIKLGFKYLGEIKADRYNQLYEKDGLTIHTDKNWINVKGSGIYYLTDLKKYCDKNGVSIDIKELNSLSYHGQVYECILPHIKNLKGNDRWNTDRVINLLLGDKESISETPNESKIKAFEFLIKIAKSDNPDKNDITKSIYEM